VVHMASPPGQKKASLGACEPLGGLKLPNVTDELGHHPQINLPRRADCSKFFDGWFGVGLLVFGPTGRQRLRNQMAPARAWRLMTEVKPSPVARPAKLLLNRWPRAPKTRREALRLSPLLCVAVQVKSPL
jgi:hypothetical protein